MNPIFDRANETMRHDMLEQVQLERLQALVARLRRNVRRYRELLGDARVESLAGLAALPVTTPEDLVGAFPYGMFALPLREVIRLDSAVGPEGRQLVIGHTRNDLLNWGRLAARQLIAAGVTSSDTMQICFGGGFFSQAMGFLRGAELIEASVIPEDPFHIEYQLEMLRSYRATVLVTTPSNARDLMALLAARRTDPQELGLRTVLLSRPVPAAERQELQSGLFGKVHASFGVPELLDPGLAVECQEGRLHVQEDHFLAEVVDGELHVTTLCREAMPLLRYRTRIAAGLERQKCPCGRTGIVLLPGARLDGRITANEMPFYKKQIAEFLATTGVGRQNFAVESQGRRLVLTLEVSQDLFGDETRTLSDLKDKIQAAFAARFGVQVEIRLTAQSQK